MGSEKEKFQRNVKVTKAPESDGDKRPEEGGGYKILIVDDEPDILDSLIFLLEKTDKFDAEIKTASSGDKALVEIEKRKFDLVLAE